ncbi:MAG: 3-isopropylmalate dehydratase small subunit [Methanocellales archaeon]|nr:3-isopropylmalate dehydratase small subunit [Methanocellales archaeon]MDD3291578.1 3-isopropylmalate dehydratase small subunit [Methanocellales archaeon]MDD5235868.1 3-isopropylmalate dehydratase small subunit [Methanocellales archaeon]MDD5485361.1 3-isopropylmalate dehydratase small subunit [Methanocellales archaeon]
MKRGNVWKFGDDVDTDAIIPGRYLTINDPNELAKYAFEGILPEFAQQVRSGDIIVAGRNFGCGSSREHAPLALKGAGISCIIAKSFARIFFRNAINIGLPVLECDEVDQIETGDHLKVDLEKGMIWNQTKDEKYPATPLPEFIRKIIEHGGLIGYTKNILGKSHDHV